MEEGQGPHKHYKGERIDRAFCVDACCTVCSLLMCLTSVLLVRFSRRRTPWVKQATVQEEAAANERKFSPSAEAHARESCTTLNTTCSYCDELKFFIRLIDRFLQACCQDMNCEAAWGWRSERGVDKFGPNANTLGGLHDGSFVAVHAITQQLRSEW